MYLWFGSDAQGRQASAQFARKLNVNRCFIILLVAATSIHSTKIIIVSVFYMVHLLSLLSFVFIFYSSPPNEKQQFSSALDALNKVINAYT